MHYMQSVTNTGFKINAKTKIMKIRLIFFPIPEDLLIYSKGVVVEERRVACQHLIEEDS